MARSMQSQQKGQQEAAIGHRLLRLNDVKNQVLNVQYLVLEWTGAIKL